MLARIRGIIAELRTNPPPLPVEEIAEAIQFLEWIAEDNFTLLGARDYVFTEQRRRARTGLRDRPRPAALARHAAVAALERAADRHRRRSAPSSKSRNFSSSPRRPCARACTGAFISITSASSASIDPASWSANTASAGCSRRPPIPGRRAPFPICGARPTASSAAPASIRSSHSGKALVNVLETYPRDELFQIDEDTLYQFALAMLQLDERPRVRVLPRRDRFDRFVSVLVYVPRDRYDGQIRAAIGNYLAAAFKGRLSAYTRSFRKARWCACNYIIGAAEGEPANPDRARSNAPSKRSCAAGPTACARRSLVANDPARGRERCSRAIATRSRSITARSIRRRSRSAIFASSRRSRRSIRSASTSTVRAVRRRHARG